MESLLKQLSMPILKEELLDPLYLSLNLYILGFGCAIVILFVADKILAKFEGRWTNIFEKIYDPTFFAGPISDFTGLDQSITQVITDTKVKFEDVAGNEEAKEELKEVIKFLKNPLNPLNALNS